MMTDNRIPRASINNLPTETLVEIFDIIQESTKHPTSLWYRTRHDPQRFFPWGTAAVCVRWFNILTDGDYWEWVGRYEDGDDTVRPGITVIVDLPTAAPPYLPQLIAACPSSVNTVQLISSNGSRLTAEQEQQRAVYVMRTLHDLSASRRLDFFDFRDSTLFLMFFFRSSIVAASQFLTSSWYGLSMVEMLGLVATNADSVEPLRIGEGSTAPTLAGLVDIVADARSFMSFVPHFEKWTMEAVARWAPWPRRAPMKRHHETKVSIGINIAEYLPLPPVSTSGVRRLEFMQALGKLSEMRRLRKVAIGAVQFDEDMDEHVQPPVPLLGPGDTPSSGLDVERLLILENSEHDNGALMVDVFAHLRHTPEIVRIRQCAFPSDELLASVRMHKNSNGESSAWKIPSYHLDLIDIDPAVHGDMRPVLARWSGAELRISDCRQIPDAAFDAMTVHGAGDAQDVTEEKAELKRLIAIEDTPQGMVGAMMGDPTWERMSELRQLLKDAEDALMKNVACRNLRYLSLIWSNFSWTALRRMLETRPGVESLTVKNGPPISEDDHTWFSTQEFSFKLKVDQ